MKVEERFLIAAPREGDQAQVVPDERAAAVELQRLAERGLGELELPHLVEDQPERIVGQHGLRGVFARLSKRDLGLAEGVLQRAAIAQGLDVTVAQLHVLRVGRQSFAVQLGSLVGRARPTPGFSQRHGRLPGARLDVERLPERHGGAGEVPAARVEPAEIVPGLEEPGIDLGGPLEMHARFQLLILAEPEQAQRGLELGPGFQANLGQDGRRDRLGDGAGRHCMVAAPELGDRCQRQPGQRGHPQAQPSPRRRQAAAVARCTPIDHGAPLPAC